MTFLGEPAATPQVQALYDDDDVASRGYVMNLSRLWAHQPQALDALFSITAFVALRLAFSTVNDALGAVPDPDLWATAPTPVADVVIWGR
jgi:hypothetical protein